MNNTKKSISIYHNKTGLILDKRKNSSMNNKCISNYASKPSQYYHHIESFIKPKLNDKKNNSVYFVSGHQKNKESFVKSKNNLNVSNNNIEMNTTNYNLM